MAAKATVYCRQVEEQSIAAKVLGKAYILRVVELDKLASEVEHDMLGLVAVDIKATFMAGRLGINVVTKFVEPDN